MTQTAADLRATPFALTTPQKRTLHGILDLPDAAAFAPPWPTVVVCHGFKGFMEWGFFPHVAELLTQRGFASVRFNFSGAGMQPGDERVTDLAAFRDDSYSRELEDLLGVLDALGEEPTGNSENGGELADERLDLTRLGLFGHSRGGAAVLLAAAHRDWAEHVKALVTWSSIAYVDRWSEDEKARWHMHGTTKVVNGRTGQELPLGLGLLEDVETNRLKLDLETAAGRRTAPWLLVHGAKDESVALAEGERLEASASGEHELQVVKGAGHTFGAVHPFAGPTPHLTQALNATQTWFRRHLTSAD